MSSPAVCCVCLVNGRPEMVRRAITSFRAQTYANKRLLIFDTGDPSFGLHRTPEGVDLSYSSGVHYYPSSASGTIGNLRNRANEVAVWPQAYPRADLIAHWDSDDWSHPRRIEEQVALLEASGKLCVGYRDLLFWDTRAASSMLFWDTRAEFSPVGEAWLYRNPDPRWAAGTSFLYRRELWEQQPFPDAPHEDQRWWCTPLVSRACIGSSCLVWRHPDGGPTELPSYDPNDPAEPRMIAHIHGSNTEVIPRTRMTAPEWRRAPEFDAFCERKMKL